MKRIAIVHTHTVPLISIINTIYSNGWDWCQTPYLEAIKMATEYKYLKYKYFIFDEGYEGAVPMTSRFFVIDAITEDGIHENFPANSLEHFIDSCSETINKHNNK